MIIDQVLELLSDGEWHNLNEVASILGVSGVKIGLIASFLNKYGFIDLKPGIKAKLTELMHQFLRELNGKDFRLIQRENSEKLMVKGEE